MMNEQPVVSNKEKRLNSTREMAFNLADDLKHIRQIVTHEKPTSGDIRRISGQLRRMLIDGDLARVAAPRLQKLKIVAPNKRNYIQHIHHHPPQIAFLEECRLYGVTFADWTLARGLYTSKPPMPRPAEATNIEMFQKQKIIYFEGTWITRTDMIKYVANVASGVHTSLPKDTVHKTIGIMRDRLHFDSNGMGQFLAVKGQTEAQQNRPIYVDNTKFDIAFLSLMGTAQHIISSPDVIELERIISLE